MASELPNEGLQLEHARTFRRFFDEHYRYVRGRVRCLTRNDDDVDDLVNSVFTVAYKRRDRLRRMDEARPWLWHISRLVTLADLRKRRRYRDRIHRYSSQVAHGSGLNRPEDTWLDRAVLEHVFAHLGERDREILSLTHLQGCTSEQVGARLGMNPNTVRSRIHKLRQVCVDLAAEHESDPSSANGPTPLVHRRKSTRRLSSIIVWPGLFNQHWMASAIENMFDTIWIRLSQLGDTIRGAVSRPRGQFSGGLAALLTIAALALIPASGSGSGAGDSERAASTQPSTPLQSAATTGLAPQPLEPETIEPTAAISDSPAASKTAASGTADSTNRPDDTRKRPPNRRRTCGHSLSDELNLVVEARSARSRGQVQRAEQLFARHATCFPQGQLADDVLADRIELACQSNRIDKARAITRRAPKRIKRSAAVSGAWQSSTCARAIARRTEPGHD